jgi:hypothetical protein
LGVERQGGNEKQGSFHAARVSGGFELEMKDPEGAGELKLLQGSF